MNEKINFVAFDFETATASRFPCQLGIVVVRGGKIVEEREWLIKPPDNKYSKNCTMTHGIGAKDTQNCLEFSELWNEIKPYFHNEVLVAHNMAFDLDVLNKAISYYQLDDIIPISCEDTCKICKYASLEDTTEHLNIDLSDHHNALVDARACAEVFIAYLNGANVSNIERTERKRTNNSFKNRQLSSDVKTQDLSIVENKNTIFYDKKVVISGVFDKIPVREELAMELKKLGADINSSISSKTNFFIIGADYGLVKMQKVKQLISEGIDIKILKEEDLIKELNLIYQK